MSIWYIYLGIQSSRKRQMLKMRRPKNKQKRRKLKKEILRLQKQKQRYMRSSFLLLLVSILLTMGAFYTRFYQQTSLSANDGEIIVQSYFLVDSIEKDIQGIQNGADPEKSQEKIRTMTALMVTYGNLPPSGSLTKERQQMLKKYYQGIRELGMNLNSQAARRLGDPKIVEDYLSDIKQLKQSQQKIFQTFKVNESALKQKK
ncbi:hypothetical protein RV09_GL003184 [Enterococcus moraviensis]|nr:hypothetical protein RV06_GL002399 [Enterococcus haemoperoxidus]OJG66967.1 hypothetical protein RV09_GL003184 [Enterococcus moraviensis]